MCEKKAKKIVILAGQLLFYFFKKGTVAELIKKEFYFTFNFQGRGEYFWIEYVIA